MLIQLQGSQSEGVFLSKVNTGRSHFSDMASKQAANSRLCRACSLSFFISHFILKHLFLCFRKVFKMFPQCFFFSLASLMVVLCGARGERMDYDRSVLYV